MELRLGRVSLSGEPERGEPERGRLERGELEREGGWQPRGEADSGVVRELRSAGIGVMCGRMGEWWSEVIYCLWNRAMYFPSFAVDARNRAARGG